MQSQKQICRLKGNGIYQLLSMENFKRGSAWIALILGCILYLFVFWLIPAYFQETNAVVCKIIETFAEVLVVGGVAGTLVNTAQNMGIFKDELKEIIYGKDFLRKRNDLPTIWEEMTDVMYKSRFDYIPPTLIKTIRKLYLPENPTFVQNRVSTIRLEWVNKSKKLVSLAANDSFEFIQGPEPQQTYKSSVSIDTKGLTKEDYFYKLSYKANGQACETITKEETKGGLVYWRNTVKLPNKGTCSIERSTQQQFSLQNDHVYSTFATIPINGFVLDFSYPKDLHAMFYNMGTTDDFEIIEQTEGHLVARSKGLILNKQGYLIAFFNK